MTHRTVKDRVAVYVGSHHLDSLGDVFVTVVTVRVQDGARLEHRLQTLIDRGVRVMLFGPAGFQGARTELLQERVGSHQPGGVLHRAGPGLGRVGRPRGQLLRPGAGGYLLPAAHLSLHLL